MGFSQRSNLKRHIKLHGSLNAPSVSESSNNIYEVPLSNNSNSALSTEILRVSSTDIPANNTAL